MTETEKINALLDITMRDLQPNASFQVVEDRATMCHQVIEEVKGQAKFTQRCCYQKIDDGYVECFVGTPNQWLGILDVLLAALPLAVFIFGPSLLPDWLYSAAFDTQYYTVKLKEPLYKTLCISRDDQPVEGLIVRHSLDLRNKQGFSECRRILSELPCDVIIPIKISRFDVNINYHKLLPENMVPVGVIESLSKAVFLCKMKELDPFRDCCEANYSGCLGTKQTTPWIGLCSIVGRILLVISLPFPFYVRLAVYYLFENPEIQDRLLAASKLDLPVHYNYRFMQHFTPLHPIFLGAYIIYFSTGLTIAYFGGKDKTTRFQQAIIDSFRDLKDMSFLSALGMLVRNFLFPFRKYGLFGTLLGLFLWPMCLPLSMLICFVYCLPIVFLTCQILFRVLGNKREKSDFTKTLAMFECENLVKNLMACPKKIIKRGFYFSLNCSKACVNGAVTLIALLTIYAAMLLIAEVVGFIAEILCFTMMGLIVNASKVLKYGSLIFLVIIYSYDTYNNVNKKYLKLNKDLFSEIKKRIKDLEEHTSLPSHLQQNRGFKSCEASEQADYEATDDLNRKSPYSWDINDLILFVDSDDNPRIPKKLFDEVCQIKAAGSPGPIYKSLLEATRQFLVIIFFLVFVFIVVMSFGDAYKISNTNQTLATLAGGFMPFLLSNLLKPSAPEVETGLVSFKSKLEEVIKNFCQSWPMHDFIFDIGERPDDEGDDGGSASKGDTVKEDVAHLDEKLDHSKGEDSRNVSTKECVLELSNPLIEPVDIKEMMENLDLESAAGKCVDLLIQVSEADQQWVMEWSSLTGIDDEELQQMRVSFSQNVLDIHE